MTRDLKHLTVDFSRIEPHLLLQCWWWLVPPAHTPVLVSAIGDLFLEGPAGSIVWLDAGAGTLNDVAATHDAFSAALNDPERLTEWLMPDLVATLRQRHGALGRNQCYSFKIPPTLSGSYEDPDNYERCDLVTHLGILGQVQQQTLGLPEGTVISGVTDVTPKKKPWWKPWG